MTNSVLANTMFIQTDFFSRFSKQITKTKRAGPELFVKTEFERNWKLALFSNIFSLIMFRKS